MSLPPIRALLFDLDGTLIDSAPDLAGAANDMRVAHGLAVLPLDHFRPMVGSGARGMVDRAFGVGPGDERFAGLRDEYLKRYEARMTRDTHVFPAVAQLLNELDRRGTPWGIVTNKAARYAEPIAAMLGLLRRAGAVVCGDTMAQAKPHPAPLLEAARRLGIEASACAYVGDDLRDVQAGTAAGMVTVAVTWGYLGLGEPVESWGAAHVIESPLELLQRLQMA